MNANSPNNRRIIDRHGTFRLSKHRLAFFEITSSSSIALLDLKARWFVCSSLAKNS